MLLLTLLQTFTPSVRFGKIPASVDVSTPEAGGTLLTTYIREIYAFGIGAGAFLAVVMVMWGGFLYITASGISAQAEKGKEAIKMAFLGLIILFTSYIMLQTINPALIALKFPPIAPIEKKGKVPDQASLPEGRLTEEGTAAGFGACVIKFGATSREFTCIPNVSKAACQGTASSGNITQRAFSGSGPFLWYKYVNCDTASTSLGGSPTKLEGEPGRCIATLPSGKECIDGVPGLLCNQLNTTWEKGTCTQSSEFLGACIIPQLLRDNRLYGWCMDNQTKAACASIIDGRGASGKWCGSGKTCNTIPTLSLDCPAK